MSEEQPLFVGMSKPEYRHDKRRRFPAEEIESGKEYIMRRLTSPDEERKLGHYAIQALVKVERTLARKGFHAVTYTWKTAEDWSTERERRTEGTKPEKTLFVSQAGHILTEATRTGLLRSAVKEIKSGYFLDPEVEWGKAVEQLIVSSPEQVESPVSLSGSTPTVNL